MRTLSLQELQAEYLALLKEVDRFCRAQGLRYSLAYGTLLGAVRHKGFIPWDDDIDIMMPRADYERLAATWTSERWKFFDVRRDPGCYLAFGRICDTTGTVAHSQCPWIDENRRTGIWVDIFPLDTAPDSKEETMRIYDLLDALSSQSYALRRLHAVSRSSYSLKDRLKIWWRKQTHPRQCDMDPAFYAQQICTVTDLVGKTPSAHLGQFASPDDRNWFPAGIVDELVELPFEDTSLLVFAAWDDILRDTYGDYMKLPPVEQQKLQQNYIKFFRL
ncbi:MAG: LicD family protein [Bacteroidales bacterium]|nr:LicD family protein [Bacteroidales bacterium]